jgi:hypothetical protein
MAEDMGAELAARAEAAGTEPVHTDSAHTEAARAEAARAEAARTEVARTVKAERRRLTRCSANALLALVSAAALAPAVVAALTGGGDALAAALAGIPGNVAGGLLSANIDRALARFRGGTADPPGTDAVRDILAADLLAALEKNDSAAQNLRSYLTELQRQIGGLQAAVEAAGDDQRAHLYICFRELAGQQGQALGALAAIGTEQRRQGRRLRDQARLTEELADRLRRLAAAGVPPAAAPPAAAPPAQRLGDVAVQQPATAVPPAVAAMQLVAPPAQPTATDTGWRAGAEVIVDDQVYLLHGECLEESFRADHAVLLRQARALRLIPAGGRDRDHVWLRQAELRHDSRPARAALAALAGEHDLLTRLGPARGLPRISCLTPAARSTTLALIWPTSRDGSPCETLHAALGRELGPVDPWRMFRLFTGLAGICGTLAGLHDRGIAHRGLTPAGLIVFDDGRLALRDLGLAARGPEPGEGPADYQATEQRRGSHRTGDRSRPGRPGPPTDVYQVAAIAYHLLAGHPPHPRMPLPLRSRGAGTLDRISTGLGAALAADPADRPSARWLGTLFRAACDDLS